MEIFAAAERFLAARMLSRRELFEKLRRKFPDEPIKKIEKTLEKCDEFGFLDDRKFAEMFLKYERDRAPKSDFLMRQKLLQKGISPEIIAEILDENPLDERAVAQKIAAKKAKMFPPNLDPKKRKERLFRFLTGRGFSFSVARAAIENLD